MPEPNSSPETPLYGGILIGGKSTRLGRPKHLLAHAGESFLDRAATALDPFVARIVILGSGELPARYCEFERRSDPAGLAGPIAGMLAAMRGDPDAAWVFAACDLPLIRPDAVAWLLTQRSADRAAVLPRGREKGVEPLLALYEPPARQLLEQLVSENRRAPRHLARFAGVYTPQPPPEIADCWKNVNAPADLDDLA